MFRRSVIGIAPTAVITTAGLLALTTAETSTIVKIDGVKLRATGEGVKMEVAGASDNTGTTGVVPSVPFASTGGDTARSGPAPSRKRKAESPAPGRDSEEQQEDGSSDEEEVKVKSDREDNGEVMACGSRPAAASSSAWPQALHPQPPPPAYQQQFLPQQYQQPAPQMVAMPPAAQPPQPAARQQQAQTQEQRKAALIAQIGGNRVKNALLTSSWYFRRMFARKYKGWMVASAFEDDFIESKGRYRTLEGIDYGTLVEMNAFAGHWISNVANRMGSFGSKWWSADPLTSIAGQDELIQLFIELEERASHTEYASSAQISGNKGNKNPIENINFANPNIHQKAKDLIAIISTVSSDDSANRNQFGGMLPSMTSEEAKIFLSEILREQNLGITQVYEMWVKYKTGDDASLPRNSANEEKALKWHNAILNRIAELDMFKMLYKSIRVQDQFLRKHAPELYLTKRNGRMEPKTKTARKEGDGVIRNKAAMRYDELYFQEGHLDRQTLQRMIRFALLHWNKLAGLMSSKKKRTSG